MGTECSKSVKAFDNIAVTDCTSKEKFYDSKEIGSFYSMDSSEDRESLICLDDNSAELANVIQGEYNAVEIVDSDSSLDHDEEVKSYPDFIQKPSYRNNVLTDSSSEEELENYMSRWKKTLDGHWIEVDQVRDQGNACCLSAKSSNSRRDKLGTISTKVVSQSSSKISSWKEKPDCYEICPNNYSAKRLSSDEESECFKPRWHKTKDGHWIEIDEMRDKERGQNTYSNKRNVNKNSTISLFSMSANRKDQIQSQFSKSLMPWRPAPAIQSDSIESSCNGIQAPYEEKSSCPEPNSDLSSSATFCGYNINNNLYECKPSLLIKSPKLDIEKILDDTEEKCSQLNFSNTTTVSESIVSSGRSPKYKLVNTMHEYDNHKENTSLPSAKLPSRKEESLVVPSIFDLDEELGSGKCECNHAADSIPYQYKKISEATEQPEVSRYYDTGVEVTSSIINDALSNFHTDPIIEKKAGNRKKKGHKHKKKSQRKSTEERFIFHGESIGT